MNMADISKVIIIDHTILPLFTAESDDDFKKIYMLLDYLIYHKKNCVIRTSQKIWEEIEKCLPEESETYKSLAAVIIPCGFIKSDPDQSYEESIIDLLTAYSKKYEEVLLISNNGYEINKINSNILLFHINNFNQLMDSDNEFIEYLHFLKDFCKDNKELLRDM